ncbi:MAG: hypothetical protein ACXAC7_04990 [Candidatus Hodarchaeales archaeon]|jgi:hypothetical protein
MPICSTCHTYYSIPPCPTCQKINKPSRVINIVDNKEIIERKVILLTSTPEELEFIWAQLAQQTIQRVQQGASMLRQGFLTAELEEQQFRIEFVGSTFTQDFSQRIERLYPGIDHVLIVMDTVNQQFRRDTFQDIFEDITNVNRRRIQSVRLIWLSYPTPSLEIQSYKEEIKTWFTQYLADMGLNVSLEENDLPIYPDRRFVEQLSELLNTINETENITDVLSLPLRPLFRVRPQLQDILPNPRVIILELESVPPPEPLKRSTIDETKIQENNVKNKCLACGRNLITEFIRCLTCQSTFCNQCMGLVDSIDTQNEDFCLGSIYYGLHKPILKKKPG